MIAAAHAMGKKRIGRLSIVEEGKFLGSVFLSELAAVAHAELSRHRQRNVRTAVVAAKPPMPTQRAKQASDKGLSAIEAGARR